MGEEDVRVAILEEKVKYLEGIVTGIQLDIREKFDRVEKKLDDALRGKISWIMSLLLTALCTTTTSLIVYITTR